MNFCFKNWNCLQTVVANTTQRFDVTDYCTPIAVTIYTVGIIVALFVVNLSWPENCCCCMICFGAKWFLLPDD